MTTNIRFEIPEEMVSTIKKSLLTHSMCNYRVFFGPLDILEYTSNEMRKAMHQPWCETTDDCPIYCDHCGGATDAVRQSAAMVWELANYTQAMITRLTNKMGREDGYFFIRNKKVIVLDTFILPFAWVKKDLLTEADSDDSPDDLSWNIIKNITPPTSITEAKTVNCGAYKHNRNCGKYPKFADAVYILSSTLSLHQDVFEEICTDLGIAFDYFLSFARTLL